MKVMFIYPRIVQRLVHDNHSSRECLELGVWESGGIVPDRADGAVDASG
jgi:hypothetical protein